MSTKEKNTGVKTLLPEFIKDLDRLQPEYSYADRIWQLHLRTGHKPKDWVMLRVTHYQETYYLSWTLCELTLELDSRGLARTSAGENLADNGIVRGEAVINNSNCTGAGEGGHPC